MHLSRPFERKTLEIMTSSQTGQSSSGAFAFPALPKLSHHSQTIVNPEGRGEEDVAPAPPPSAHPNSSVWQRLFPQSLGSSDETPEADLPTPEGFELGHFVLQERIGIGGMGAVFRAIDTRLQRVVALKVLGPAQSRDESSVKRFQNEASAAARLDHDNIARVYYIGEDFGLHYIAFEYITGTNLRDLIRQGGPISPVDAVNYTLQIAGALNHTHAAGVVHRDIKPSNIIIMPGGRAKLVDLGLARRQNSDSVADLTLAGTTLGTFDYISPEQAKDPRRADVRSDIYSLGCTLYHALTGVPPYPEGTVLQKLLDHQGKDAPDPILKNRHIPPDLSAICRKMMASDPKYRYATPELVVRDLIPLAARMGLKGLPADGLIWRHVTPPKESVWQRHFGWVASVAVLLTIVFVIWRFPNLGSPSAGDPAVTNRLAPSRSLAAKDASTRPATGESDGSARESDAPPVPVPPPAKDSDDESINDPSDDGEATTTSAITKNLSTPEEKTAGKGPFGFPLMSEGNTSETEEVASNPEDLDLPLFPPGSLLEEPASSADSSAPDEEKPPTSAETKIRPYWVIQNDGSDDESKFTLEAACKAAADSGQIVEIRHDGMLPIDKPIDIQYEDLIIRAGVKPSGENFRPILRFTGVKKDSIGLRTRLFRLSNASLDLINLDFHITPQSGAMSENNWALAALEGGGRIHLKGVTVTMDEQDRGLPAIVELLPSQTVNDMKMMSEDGGAPGESFDIKVKNSVLRGSCNVFHTQHTRPGRIEVEQSAIAVEGSLLKAEGDLELKSEDDDVELTMNHTTCLVGRSLILMDSGVTRRDLLPVHVRNTRNNLIATNVSNNPLIAMRGDSDLEVYEGLFRWEGSKNFFDGFDMFWDVSTNEFMPRNFEAWLKESNTNETKSQNGGVVWKGRWATMEFPSITAEDIALDRDPEVNNPAVDAATDGRDVGADLKSLPPVPHRDLAAQP